MRLGKFFRQTERDHATAGANIQNCRFSIFDFRFDDFHQLLRFGPRNECAVVAKKNVAAKFHSAEQMLKRLPFAPASDKIAQWREFCFVKSALELQVKFHARAAERISEQMLRIQSRILDSSFFEIRSRRLQHFKDGHDVLRCIYSLLSYSAWAGVNLLSGILLARCRLTAAL